MPPKGLLQFPISRVKTIMKSSPDLESVRQEPLVLVAHLVELFVADFAKRAHENSGQAPVLEYKHLAELVQQDDTLDFLREIMPPKITVKQFKEIMARKAAERRNEADTSDSDLDDEPESAEVDETAEAEEPIEVQEGVEIEEDVIVIEDDSEA